MGTLRFASLSLDDLLIKSFRFFTALIPDIILKGLKTDLLKTLNYFLPSLIFISIYVKCTAHIE